jgi:hypothetical protein
MKTRQWYYWIFIAGFLVFYSTAINAQVGNSQISSAEMKNLFKTPPASASPWVFWYWHQASISRQGITADLEAMKKSGIGGAYLMPIKGPAIPPHMDSSLVQLTPEWWRMVRHAFEESKRLGLKLAIHVSDGFALAGGPWISPEMSMQKIVWSKTEVAGGKPVSTPLPQPETLENYYKDIAVFAYPSPSGSELSTRTIMPKITSSKQDTAAFLLTNPENNRGFGCDEQCWVQYSFDQPFTCRSITIRSRNNYQANRLIIETSDDGQNFRSIGRLDPPRHGWQDWDSDYTHSIPAITAKHFRFVFDKDGSEPGAEDLDAAKWRPSLRITGIELSGEARVHQYEGKSAQVWRISPFTTKEQAPDSLCIPLKQLIDITANMGADGRINWTAPPGNWTILRIGHTSTGHRNETAGGGKGLECDKFSTAAVTLQFDQWFSEIVRRMGPGLSKDVLSMLHVDSWECGSQNWSSGFREEFRRRRGYDLMPYLPVMTGLPVENAAISERFLLDVRETIAELVNDIFYKTLSSLSKKQGFSFSAESVAPTMVGDGMLHYQNTDIPMGEFWLRSPTHDKPNDMLDAISGAHIYGKKIIKAEGFTQLRMAWDEYPGMLKTLMDRNFALGINRLSFHVFMHNPWMDRKPGMTLDAIGLFFQRDQTWWQQSRAIIEYTRRCQYLLQLGWPVTDLAVFTGEDIPRRAILPDRLVPVLPGLFGKEKLEQENTRLKNEGQPLRQLPAGVTHGSNMADPENWIDPLRGYAYDSYNRDALLRLSVARNGKLKISGGPEYKLLVLPGEHKMSPNSMMSLEVVAKLKELRNGGVPMIINSKPEQSTSLLQPVKNDLLLQNLVAQITGSKPGAVGKNLFMGVYTDSSLAGFGIAPDFLVKEQDGKRATAIAWTHRQDGQRDIYFISNQKDSNRIVELSLRISGKIPELWNPVDGSVMNAKTWRMEKGRTLVPVQLEKNGSLFIVFQTPSKLTSGRTGKNWKESRTIKELNTPWTVQFDPAFRGPVKPVVFEQLTDWSQHEDSAIRYYSGAAQYTTDFNWTATGSNKQFVLQTGTVHNIAEVFVNGISCGIAWTAPYEVEITKALRPGKNSLRIEVINTWANRLIGDRRLPEEKRLTKTNSPYRLEGKPLLPGGVIGPVRITERF